MKSYIVTGGKKLSGKFEVSGSKNAVLKVVIAACLTDEVVEIRNVPLISDLFTMIELIKEIGGKVEMSGHTVKIQLKEIKNHRIPIETGAKTRTSSMFVAPLLARARKALIPNPGGCRIGARPIDRHVEGLVAMGAKSHYDSGDGYFSFETEGLHGATYRFPKNSHTGTETLIMAGVLAKGVTRIENAALEPEVDELIKFLNAMGAKIKREGRTIEIDGIERLHGAVHTINPDRNEVVTLAILSALTGGEILIGNILMDEIKKFLDEFKNAGGKWEEKDGLVRFYIDGEIKPCEIETRPHPGFMTDWQGPWAIFMTQANGESIIHETIYENRFGYFSELKKMGSEMELFAPNVTDPGIFYNFNWTKEDGEIMQGLKINGKTPLHNALLKITDLRAGATLVIAALIAQGRSVIYGVEYLERGYEAFDEKLRKLGAEIEVVEEK